MKASQAIIMYDNDEGSSLKYAEHYDIVNGNMVNAKPVLKDFFTALVKTESTDIEVIPEELLAMSSAEIIFHIPSETRLIKLAIDNGSIEGMLHIPHLVFHINKNLKAVYVYEYDNGILYEAPFPNILSDKICFGTTVINFNNGIQPLINEVINMFFCSRFSSHYNHEMFDRMKLAIETNQTEYYDKTKRQEASCDIQRFITRLL